MAPQRMKSPKVRVSSSAAADNDEHHPPPQGCLHGLFHLLDLNQRLHLRKMLPYKRHIYGTKTRKVKQMATLSCEGKESMDTDGNMLMEDKSSITNESSGKALMRSQNSKGSTGLESKRNNSLRASRLLRTISIHHHLEGDGYVDSMAPQTENPTNEQELHDDSFSADREHIPLSSKTSDEPTFHKACEEPCGSSTTIDNANQSQLDGGLSNHLQEKQSLLEESSNEAKENLSKQSGKDANEMENGVFPFHQSKEFLDMMVLLNSNRELFLKLLNDPSVIDNYLQSQQISTPDRVLGRLRSFTVMGSPSRKKDGKKPQKTESPVDPSQDFQTGTSSSSPDTNDKPIVGDRLSPSFLEGQRKSQKEDGTSPNRFKVIKKRIKDVIKDNRKEGLRISMDGVIDKIPYGTKLSKDAKKANQCLLERPASVRYDIEESKSLKRCQSLHESMDKYCRLFQSISSRDLKRVPDSSKTNQEVSGASHRPKSFARILSLPSFESCSLRTDVECRAPNANNPPKLPEPPNLYNFGETQSVDTSVSKEENVEADKLVQVATDLDATKTVYEDKEQPILRNEQDTFDIYDVSKDLTIEDSSRNSLHKEAAKDEVDLSEEPTTQTSISESEGLIVPSPLVDPELEARHMIHYEEMAPLTNQQSQLNLDASYELEGSMLADLDDNKILHVQVDEKDEAEFNYVRDILWKSGFGGEESSGTWYSPDQPVDPLLYEETEYTHEAGTETYEPDSSVEHNQLLFDLTNEVLLDIYDASFAFCPWVSCFDPRVRPMPVEHHVLEEVWANVRWYLKYQPNLDDLDHVVARDFAKNDGWMELQYDCEYVGLELEELILDELLDELLLQLVDTR